MLRSPHQARRLQRATRAPGTGKKNGCRSSAQLRRQASRQHRQRLPTSLQQMGGKLLHWLNLRALPHRGRCDVAQRKVCCSAIQHWVAMYTTEPFQPCNNNVHYSSSHRRPITSISSVPWTCATLSRVAAFRALHRKGKTAGLCIATNIARKSEAFVQVAGPYLYLRPT